MVAGIVVYILILYTSRAGFVAAGRSAEVAPRQRRDGRKPAHQQVPLLTMILLAMILLTMATTYFGHCLLSAGPHPNPNSDPDSHSSSLTPTRTLHPYSLWPLLTMATTYYQHGGRRCGCVAAGGICLPGDQRQARGHQGPQ